MESPGFKREEEVKFMIISMGLAISFRFHAFVIRILFPDEAGIVYLDANADIYGYLATIAAAIIRVQYTFSGNERNEWIHQAGN